VGYVAVLLATAVYDYMWGKYIRAVARRSRLRASLFSSAIYLSGMYVTINVVRDPRMLAAAVAGAFAGTWLSVERRSAQDTR